MKRKIIIALVISLFAIYGGIAYAQTYSTAIGFRGGLFSGITVKHAIGANKLVEGIVASKWDGIAIIGLLEFQKQTTTDHLYWYWGFGGHVATYDRFRYYDPHSSHYYSGNFLTVGVDGILGLEYQFKDIPLDLSVDVKPYIDFIDPIFNIFDGAVSARYYF